MRYLHRCVLLIATIGGSLPTHDPQAPAPSYPSRSSLTADDEAAIRGVAKMAGISEIGEMDVDLVHMPLGCFVVRVQSRIVASGNQRTWREMWAVPVKAANNRYCAPATSSPYRSGAWTIEGQGVMTREVWRIAEGPWHFDVALQAVTYETASRIVLALKNKKFVDRRKSKEPGPFGDSLLIGGPAYLRTVGDRYELQMGSSGGLYVVLRVTADAVEVIDVQHWIS